MKRLSYRLLFGCAIPLLVSLQACKKHTTPPAKLTADVYVAGEIDEAGGAIPVYWKNGVAVKLNSPNKYGEAYAITIVGSDIYIAGRTNNTAGSTDGDALTVWKNGVATLLPNDNRPGIATGISVSGTDVYVSGYSYNLTYSRQDDPVPTYWKNGVIDTLPSSSNHAQAMGITVSGTDVYVAGYDLGYSGVTAMYWKNGVMTSLGVGQVTAMTASGSDIYVAGAIYGPPQPTSAAFVAGCWKNSTSVPLALTNQVYYTSNAYAIAVSGTDVYVAGNSQDPNGSGAQVVTYWKNGEPVTFPSGNSLEPIFGSANGIAVSGSDVYLAGNVFDVTGKQVLTYWKNGIATTINDQGNITAIAVVPLQ